eukprot:15092066-Alexandrium_andersonii.AAC.1
MRHHAAARCCLTAACRSCCARGDLEIQAAPAVPKSSVGNFAASALGKHQWPSERALGTGLHRRPRLRTA